MMTNLRLFLCSASFFLAQLQTTHSFQLPSPPPSSSPKPTPTPQPQSQTTKDINAVVIVPGFMTTEHDFKPLAQSLQKRGIPAAIVPLPSIWNWIACFVMGGLKGELCMSPILERIDYTVKYVCGLLSEEDIEEGVAEEIVVPPYRYGLLDCVKDMMNCMGKRTGEEEEEEKDYSTNVDSLTPLGNFEFSMTPSVNNSKKNIDTDEIDNISSHDTTQQTRPQQVRICLVGHSAGGWISRMYLSSRPYFGKSYCGTNYVHSLVTLGTPHRADHHPQPQPQQEQQVSSSSLVPISSNNHFAFQGIKWINREKLPVRGVAVGGVGSCIHDSGDFTRHSYSFCGVALDHHHHHHDNDKIDHNEKVIVDGDGMTPVHSALALEGDDVHKITLEGVTHYPWSNAGLLGDWIMPDLAAQHREGKTVWYGDDDVVDLWAGFLMNRKNKEEEEEEERQ